MLPWAHTKLGLLREKYTFLYLYIIDDSIKVLPTVGYLRNVLNMTTIRLLIRPALFTVGVCGTCFCGAAIIQHERQRYSPYSTSASWRTQVTDPFSKTPGWMQRQYQTQQDGLLTKFIEFRRQCKQWWSATNTSQTIALGTIFINSMVFLAWRSRSPAIQSVMNKYFISRPSTTRIALSPMILSCFSHKTTTHLAINMFALYSFSSIATYCLGPEQLIGMYLSAGTASSLASLAHRTLTGRTIPSLGASGALLGVIAYTCVKQPDSQLLLFLLIPLYASTALKGIVALDTVGLFASKSIFDHAAHLGGSLFGIWYANYGEDIYKRYRQTIAYKWYKLKNYKTSD